MKTDGHFRVLNKENKILKAMLLFSSNSINSIKTCLWINREPRHHTA